MGGLLENPVINTWYGVLPPLEAWLRFQQNSCTPSLVLTVSVFSYSPRQLLHLCSPGKGMAFSSKSGVLASNKILLSLGLLCCQAIAIAKQLSKISWWSTITGSFCRKWVWNESHRRTYDWQQLLVKGSIVLPFYGCMAYRIDTLQRISSLSDFPINI